MEKLVELQQPIRDMIKESVMESLQPGASLPSSIDAKIRDAQAGPINELYVKILKVITSMETAQGLGIKQPFERLRVSRESRMEASLRTHAV